MQRYFASGAAIFVSPDLDLVEAAFQMSEDNALLIRQWMTAAQFGRVSDEQARDLWLESDAMLWVVVVSPWVLVQPVAKVGGVVIVSHGWFYWALLSAIFAAMTAIFAKIGLQGVNSDYATLIRTFVILMVLMGFVYFTGKWSDPFDLGRKTWLFLTLSALATGASWVCYFRALQLGEASRVAPVDKFSVVLVAIFAVMFLGERPGIREWLGIGLVTAGVVVLSFRR